MSAGSVAAARDLLEHGADCRIRNIKGESALQRALVAEEDEIASLLMAHGAEVGLVELALIGDRVGVEKLLPSKQSRDTEILADALYAAAGRGRTDIVALLLDRGANIDASRGRGRTAIANAVWWERVDTVRLLVARGAALDDKCEAEDCCSWTPLMQACLFGKLEIAQILLEAGADPNIFTDETVDYATSNALMLAVTGEKVEVIRLLLRYGADVNARSSDGENAIDHARSRLTRLLPPGSSRERAVEILSVLEEWDASHREII